jgi:hypothetical protein
MQPKNAVRVVIKINVKRKRGKVIPKKRWFDTIKNYMKAVGMCDVGSLNQGWSFPNS